MRVRPNSSKNIEKVNTNSVCDSCTKMFFTHFEQVFEMSSFKDVLKMGSENVPRRSLNFFVLVTSFDIGNTQGFPESK